MKSPKCVSLAEFEEHMAKPSSCATSDDQVEEYKRQFFTYIFGIPICLFAALAAIFAYIIF